MPSKSSWERSVSTACSLTRPQPGLCRPVWGHTLQQACLCRQVPQDPWGSASRLLVHAENQTSRATQTKLRAIAFCLKVCQGAIKQYVFPADQHRSPHGSVIVGDLLIPLTTAKFVYKCESPSRPGAFVPKHWLAQNCRRNRPWEETVSCTHLWNGCFRGFFHFLTYCMLNYPEGKLLGGYV